MTHEFCRDHLGEYLDQSLDPGEREKVVSHLESCASCAQIAREMVAIRTAMHEMAPLVAPTNLRQNVRAALQVDLKSPATRPTTATRPAAAPWLPGFWRRLPQLAWSAPLAVAALALIVLARPFANAPLTLSEPALPSSPNANQTAADAPQTAASATTRVKSQAAAKPIPPSKPAPGSLSKASGSARELGAKNQSETKITSSEPNAARQSQADATSSGAALGLQHPRARRAQTSPQIRPTRPPLGEAPSALPRGVPAPSAPPLVSPPPLLLRKSGAATNAPTPVPTPVPTLPSPEAEAFAPSMRRSRYAPPAPAVGQADLATSPQQAPAAVQSRTSRPSFSMQLRSAPAPAVEPAAPAITDSAAATTAPSASGGHGFSSPRRAAPRQDELRQPNEAYSGSGAATPFNGLAAPPTRAMPNPAARAAKPDASAKPDADRAASAPAPAFRAAAGGARRFSLQIQAARATKNARIRIEVASPLRLLWPVSSRVWSGDLAPAQAVEIAFSLGGVRGGEKISVVVEQIGPGARSTLIETQTLILPPAP